MRAYRWLGRRAAGCLNNRRPGGSPVHGLRPAEEAEIIKLFHEWGETGRSHRKLAHRGSYLRRVQVSPSGVRGVLAAHGLGLRRPKRLGTSARKPFPDMDPKLGRHPLVVLALRARQHDLRAQRQLLGAFRSARPTAAGFLSPDPSRSARPWAVRFSPCQRLW